MLGHMLLYLLRQRPELDVWGSVRRADDLAGRMPADCLERLVEGVTADSPSSLAGCLERVRPDVAINCIGVIRQLPEGRQPLPCINLNARLPHVLLELCQARGIRFIHYSTDCVFDGHKGTPYTEDDPPSAHDIYGMTKYLGEVRAENALTIRTSIIGPELKHRASLLEWFLGQEQDVNGYTRALYTGLPTAEHARILADYVLPLPQLSGLFHVASKAISKYDLLRMIAAAYGKHVAIHPLDTVCEDKRLNGEAFAAACGYHAPEWPVLVQRMKESHQRYLEDTAV